MFIPLPLLTCLLLSAALQVSESLKYSESAEKESLTRGEKILEEINKLGKHDWAGEYVRGHGLGFSRILLSPTAGYVFEEHGCLGVYDRNYGSVTFKRDLIKLSFTFDPTTRRNQVPASEYLIVRWGERRYLVPSNEVIDFCSAFNLYGNSLHVWLFFKKDNLNHKVRGKPKVPVEYQSYLLGKPVEATIIAVGASTLRPSIADWKFKDTVVTIDAGSRQGLREGMELAVTIPEYSSEKVRITKVMENHSEGLITQIGEKWPAIEVGSNVSTRSPQFEAIHSDR